MQLGKKLISELIVWDKYAKYSQEKKRRETYNELCDRVEDMFLNQAPAAAKEVKWAMSFMRNREVLSSMRCAQFAGKPIVLSPSRVFNCAYMPAESRKFFREAMFLLIGGTGLGYSVESKYVSKLPIRKKITKKARVLVGDSKEGWSHAVDMLFKGYLEQGIDYEFDYSDIRPKGTPLKTAGGLAPGHHDLEKAIENCRSVLKNVRVGRKLTTLNVHDCVCYIASAIRAGGIRRAALIAYFDYTDNKMMQCKFAENFKNWGEDKKNEQRALANNSAVLFRDWPKEKLDTAIKEIMKACEESKCGEPGWIITSGEFRGNPCSEIKLLPFQMCVAGDTPIITRDGVVNIADSVGEAIEIWNGKRWSKVNPIITGHGRKLLRVKFRDGSYLDCTEHHRFSVKNRFESEYREVRAEDLHREKYTVHTETFTMESDSGYFQENAYELGFAYGDGCIKGNNKVVADLFGEKMNISMKGTARNKGTNNLGTEYQRFTFDEHITVPEFRQLREEGGMSSILHWNKESMINFISGLADADGSNTESGAVRIYVGQEANVRYLQLALTKCGIRSSVNLMAKKGEETNFGARKRDIWYVQISNPSKLKCQRLNTSRTEEPKTKGKYQTIVGIEELPGKHTTYCFEEEETHKAVFNNSLTYQCNLTEGNASIVRDKVHFLQLCRALAIIGTVQASFTNFHFLRPEWKETTEKEALIGCSFTGICHNKINTDWYSVGREVIKATNRELAEKIGINPAARLTTIKPAGTTSLVLGGVTSGCHAGFGSTLIRRVTVSKHSALGRYAKVKLGGIKAAEIPLIEECAWDDSSWTIPIPLSFDGGTVTKRADETIIDQLNRVKTLMLDWIGTRGKSGSQIDSECHTVSFTGYVREGEWSTATSWILENKGHVSGMSFLPYDGGTYTHPPFQEIDRDTYDALHTAWEDVDFNIVEITEEEDLTKLTQELACSGGNCDV